MQEQGAAPPVDPAAAPPADPAAAPPAEPAAAPPAVPEAPVDVNSQSIVDVDLARRLALNLAELSTSDRTSLINQVTPENVDSVREALNSILEIFDAPKEM